MLYASLYKIRTTFFVKPQNENHCFFHLFKTKRASFSANIQSWEKMRLSFTAVLFFYKPFLFVTSILNEIIFTAFLTLLFYKICKALFFQSIFCFPFFSCHQTVIWPKQYCPFHYFYNKSLLLFLVFTFKMLHCLLYPSAKPLSYTQHSFMV